MEDLEPVLAKLKDNLIGKNVASEVATSLIESVMVKLEGSVMGTFQSIASTVKDALTQSLMKLSTEKPSNWYPSLIISKSWSRSVKLSIAPEKNHRKYSYSL